MHHFAVRFIRGRVLAALPVIVSVTALSQPAQAQTAPTTPSPVVTPTPSTGSSLPDANTLMHLANKAVAARNTLRLSLVMDVTVPEVSTTHVREVLDISQKPQLAHAITTSATTDLTQPSPQAAPALPQVVVVVKRMAATQQGKNKWTCLSVGKIAPSGPASIAELTGTPDSVVAHTVGAETLNGIKVWHIHVDASSTSHDITIPMALEYYIRRDNHLPVKTTMESDTIVQGTTTHQVETATYSRYGKTVKVKLPVACAGNPIKRSAAVAPNVVLSPWSYAAAYR